MAQLHVCLLQQMAAPTWQCCDMGLPRRLGGVPACAASADRLGGMRATCPAEQRLCGGWHTRPRLRAAAAEDAHWRLAGWCTQMHTNACELMHTGGLRPGSHQPMLGALRLAGPAASSPAHFHFLTSPPGGSRGSGGTRPYRVVELQKQCPVS